MLEFTTINCEDEYIKWDLSVEELKERYFNSTDIPDGDDPVTRLKIAGIPLYVTKFDDIVELLGLKSSGR